MATYARRKITIWKRKETKFDQWLRLIEIIFPERFPHFYKYSWGISFEYLPGWPKPTEEEIIGLYLCHTIFINFKVVSITDKKMSQFQKQRPDVFFWKTVLKTFAIKKTPVLESSFNRLARFKTSNFLKKRLQHRCFPVNIAKFLRTVILMKICEQLLLQFLLLTVNISS